MRVQIPNNWQPRSYQLPAWNYLENGGKRANLIWHRRAGKDDLCLHWGACAAVDKPATYWHMLPKANQARKAIWNAVNPHTGKRRIDEAFPKEIRDNTQEQEMLIRLKTGSTWQVLGSDNYDSAVGAPPYGVTYSEWPLSDPASWAYIRPILAENGGWALFNGTPRGRNHAYTHYQAVKEDPHWFTQILTARETGIFSTEQLDQELKEYIDMFGQREGRAKFEQEYLCSFEAAIVGSYYGSELADLETKGRIGTVSHDRSKKVITAWDIGRNDATTIWFAQRHGTDCHLIDYYEASECDVTHYLEVLENKRLELGYQYSKDIYPHDIQNHEWLSPDSRLQVMHSHGRQSVVLKQSDVDDGIAAVCRFLPKCVFDQEKCKRGLDCLRQYRKEFDPKKHIYKHVHDWSSHGADAFRYLVKGWEEATMEWSGEAIRSR